MLAVIIKTIFIFNLVVIDCDSPFDKEVTVSGTPIISPNYPSSYENNKDCITTIRFAAGEVVNITFEAFNVETDEDCSYDYLAVFDGNSTSSSMIGSKLCGSSLSGTTLQSTGNTMTLYFHTDDGQTRNGFKLHASSGKIHDIITNCFNIFSKS